MQQPAAMIETQKIESAQSENASRIQASACTKLIQGWKDALRGWIKQEIIAILKLIFPNYMNLFLTQSVFLVSLIFVGHITGNTVEIDAAGLSVSIINMTGFSVVYGAGTAIDTLCSQAFGYKAYKRIGIILQQGIFIIGLSIFPIVAFWQNTESILTLLNQDPCVVSLTAQYIRIFSVALPFIFLNVLLSKYLQTQSIVVVLIVIGFVTNVVNILLNSILLYGYDLGFVGAVLAITLSQSSTPFFLLVYIWACGLHKQTWGGWSWESLVDWWTFTKLALPGLLMFSLKWWSNEVGMIIIGMIGKTELAMYAISVNITLFLFLIAFSISLATTIRIGNELGAGNTKGAKRIFYLSLTLGVGEALVSAVALQALKYQLASVFTTDDIVINGFAKLMNVVPFFVFFDHVQGVLAGVLRGCGQQLLGAISNIVCFYFIGLPIGICLALVAEMGAMGYWVGTLCGCIIQSVYFLIVALRMDWEKQAKMAIEKASCRGRKEQDIAGEEVTTQHHSYNAITQGITTSETTPQLDGRKSYADCRCLTYLTSSKLKVVLYRGSFLVIAVAILVTGVVGSHFTPSFAERNCSEVTTTMINESMERMMWL